MKKKLSELLVTILVIACTLGVIIFSFLYEWLQRQNRNTIDLEARAVSTWSKNEIIVYKNQTARIRIINTDTVSHGFAIPEIGVPETVIEAGKIKIVEFVPKWSGKFVFMCTVQCSVEKHAYMKGYLIVKEDASDKTDEKVEDVMIQVLWNYSNLSLRMKSYEPGTNRRVKLWEMASRKDKKDIPISVEIEDGIFYMKPGNQKYFAIVMRNNTSRPVYFFASPHMAFPPESSLGFKFKCLCVNEAFEVGPHETWYRIVNLRLSPDYFGNSLKISHTLIGISRERMEKFKSLKPMKHEDHEEHDHY